MYTFTLRKKGEVHAGKGKVIPREAAEEAISADELLRHAEEEAKEIIATAHEDGQEICAQAKKEGFQEGLTQWSEQLKLFEQKLKVLRHEMQKAMLPLVLKSVKKIVGNELEINPDSVVKIVQESIKNVSTAKMVKLYVNRGDLELLEQEKSALKTIFENLETLTIEERTDVDRGGCIIETERGILNATLENQYRALERAFETYTKK